MDTQTIAQELGSIRFIIAYLAFGFAAAGFANVSRHRWEDLALSRNIDRSLPLAEAARTQAGRDFCNWFRFMIGVSVGAVALTLFCLFQTGPNQRGLLFHTLFTVLTGLTFFVWSYRTEKKEFGLNPTTRTNAMSNQASEATSEPAPGADSSSPRG